MAQEIIYVDSPNVSWEELKTYNQSPPTSVLPRSLEVVKSYKKHKQIVKKEYKSINDYLITKLFTKKGTKHMYKIVPNDFPYTLEDNIEHLVCWFNPSYFDNTNPSLNSVPNQVNTILKLYRPNLELGINCIYFENDLINRSVPGIRHIHIFIKN